MVYIDDIIFDNRTERGKFKLHLNKKQQFGALIRSIRKKQHMTQSELGGGIYKVALISRIEQGKFLPNKLIRDRLLERLGESSYDYETYIEVFHKSK